MVRDASSGLNPVATTSEHEELVSNEWFMAVCLSVIKGTESILILRC